MSRTLAPLAAVKHAMYKRARFPPPVPLLVLALRRVLLRPRLAALFLIFLVGLGFLLIFIVFIILVLKLRIIGILILLKLQGLASEPINGARDKLLLDVLAKLVVKLETLLDVGRSILVLVWSSRGAEEVEEGLSGDRLLDDTGLLGI